MNGHGGNNGATVHIHEIINELPGVQVQWYSWWQSNSVLSIAQKYDIDPSHANWLEAFQFTRVSELPSGEKQPPVVPGLMDAKKAREVYGDGTFGGVYQVDDKIMQEMFDACLKDILRLLEFND